LKAAVFLGAILTAVTANAADTDFLKSRPGAKPMERAYEKDPISLDMFNSPIIKPQEQPITYPTNTMPVHGKEKALSRDDAETQLTNPVASSPESIAKGKYAFSKHCSACHGLDAKGETPVAAKLAENGSPLWDITLTIGGRGDGYIYGTIRNGGINMPAYGGQTSPEERWHIVNYLRSLVQQ
jgi:mono/diheme cytochrome c family protein